MSISFARCVTLVLLLFSSTLSSAQQTPQYSLYSVNSFLFNPAVGGIESYIDLRIGQRSQWTSIEGAPTSSYISIHAPLARKERVANPKNEPKKRRHSDLQTDLGPHHSIGGILQQDKTGNFERYEANISYGYHLPLSPKYTISVGGSGGVRVR